MRPLIFFLGGAAALSWQVIWQHHVALGIGASAQAVALTIATAMVGMTAGAIWCGSRLKTRRVARPMRLYGAFELAIGILAQLPLLTQELVARADAAIFREVPGLATPFTLAALALTIGPASLLMGATIPVIGLAAGQVDRPISRYYGFNTAGAAVGALGVAFLLIPNFGMRGSAFVLTTVHLGLAAASFAIGRRTSEQDHAGENDGPDPDAPASIAPDFPQSVAWTYAFVTGFVGFLLEVAWFRSLRAAWLSTTDTFAILLFCFLVALAIGAMLVPRIRKLGMRLPAVLGVASILVLLATPVIERFDLFHLFGGNYHLRALSRVILGFLVIGPAVVAIGISLPTLLDEVRRPRQWAVLYGWNTLGAVLGSITGAWVLLPLIGFAPTAWVAGGILAAVALWQFPSLRSRFEFGIFLVPALAVAILGESGIGGRRAQGTGRYVGGDHELLASVNGPDVTTAVVGYRGGRALFIDGYAATAQFDSNRAHYMDAMGRLPMLLHPDPTDALVICFGTGQTAHAVRDENPERLTLVDLNPAVFQLADLFPANQGVISDPRVRVRVMDGRAWLRRSPDRYDVVTLEPMPPSFAGSNSLYSVEFYRAVRDRLKPGGYLAQWFPLHLITPDHARSIAAAFVEVLPDSILWLDPNSVGGFGVPEQAILIGRSGAENTKASWEDWPGFSRKPGSGRRPMREEQARASIFLRPDQLGKFAGLSVPVSDDNQVLSYGADVRHWKPDRVESVVVENAILLDLARE